MCLTEVHLVKFNKICLSGELVSENAKQEYGLMGNSLLNERLSKVTARYLPQANKRSRTPRGMFLLEYDQVLVVSL